MEQQNTNWMDEEIKDMGTSMPTGDKLPGLKIESGKMVSITIDFSKPFEKWTETRDGKTIVKKIMPCLHNGERKNFWLNVKNPLYAEILKAGKAGKTEFKIVRTGAQEQTRYQIIDG